MCFGGGSDPVNSVNTDATNLFNAENARRQTAFGSVMPYASSRMSTGIPEFKALSDFSNPAYARSAGLSRNAMLRNFAGAGMKSNDPGVLQGMNDFEASRARGFDDNMVNLIMAQNQAKDNAARMMAAIAAGSDPMAALGVRQNIALS